MADDAEKATMADDVEKATATIAASNTEPAPPIMRPPVIVIPYVRWYHTIKWTVFTCLSFFVLYQTEYDPATLYKTSPPVRWRDAHRASMANGCLTKAPGVFWILMLYAVGSFLTTMLALYVDVTYPYADSEKGD
ncbi:hypothetical protein Bbelb_100430 [Branchiostoma belcheri]|nr:hypothetical protein Bbelb_100430 [Branchiostoma belcheri]